MTLHQDKFGRAWDLPENELCPECGQPDSCGDCNHERLSDYEVSMLVTDPGLRAAGYTSRIPPSQRRKKKKVQGG